jgi:hypothetical protein
MNRYALNDHEAIEAINKVLEACDQGEVNDHGALMRIAVILGRNTISHQEAAQ